MPKRQNNPGSEIATIEVENATLTKPEPDGLPDV